MTRRKLKIATGGIRCIGVEGARFEENGERGEGKTGFGVVVAEEDDAKSEMDQQAVRDGRCFKDNPSSEFAN